MSKIRTVNSRSVSFVLAVVLVIMPGLGLVSGIYVWLSPFVMINSLLALKSVVWMNIAGFIITLVVVFRKRWFCRRICPMGLLCDTVSAHSLRKSFTLKKIPPAGTWLMYISFGGALAGIPLAFILDPMTIFQSFFSLIQEKPTISLLLSALGLPLLLGIHLFFPGIWCSKLCPLGAFQNEIHKFGRWLSPKKGKNIPAGAVPDIGRRAVIFSGIGLAAGLAIPGFVRASGVQRIRPPGSVHPGLFNFLCVRCGNCIKSCPTGILTHHTDHHDLLSWMVPEIVFNDGYCLENCNTCSVVCPSGAITLFSKQAKKELPVGLAVVHPDKCLLLFNTECDRCKTSCPYDAIAVVSSGTGIAVLPEVNSMTCTGCGACEVVCPAQTIEVFPSVLHKT